jgi:hypothetical protein
VGSAISHIPHDGRLAQCVRHAAADQSVVEREHGCHGKHGREPGIGEGRLHLTQAPSNATACGAIEQIDREAPLEHHDERVHRPHQRHPHWRHEHVLHHAEQAA